MGAPKRVRIDPTDDWQLLRPIVLFGQTAAERAPPISGARFKKGPAVGEALAELILDGASRTVDLSPFRLDRFATDAWREPWSDSEYVFTSDFGHKC